MNPNILEAITNQQVLQTVMLTPSLLLAEAWKASEFKDFYVQIFRNLFEHNPQQLKALSEQSAWARHVVEQFGFSAERAQHYHYLWEITEREV